MLTVDGQKIELKLTNMGPDPEKGLKYAVWAPAIFYILLIFAPLILLANKHGMSNLVPILGVTGLIVAVLGYLYMRKMVVSLSPLLPHRGALLSVHFRLFFVSSILCFVFAEIAPIFLVSVLALWSYAEFRHFSTLRRVMDDDLAAAYAPRFSTLDDGIVQYDSRLKTEDLVAEPWPYTRSAELILLPVFVVGGGYLFLRSFAFRDNFEPRMLVAGFIALLVALLVRSFITHVALDIRAVNLKAQGKF